LSNKQIIHVTYDTFTLYSASTVSLGLEPVVRTIRVLGLF